MILSDVLLSDSDGITTVPIIVNGQIIERKRLEGDVNNDGVVNISDLVLVANAFGQTGTNDADVNNDGVVNISDLVLVANAFGNTASSPSLWFNELDAALTRSEVKTWLREARVLNLPDADFQNGIRVLEQIFIALTPKETALLPNFPNPFNPETWIPYQLAQPANVVIYIYGVNGSLIRTLSLGHQDTGKYHLRSNAAYWDGKNEFGEPVSSGIYFYTLTAGDFTATRKMLIRK
ncbi:MAG: dockerin type I domain-containing protein [Candidatus Poribacteria bacterium]|nr:dockerin type I domain-containing protein [Candidatus Poribacteria bacterium]